MSTDVLDLFSRTTIFAIRRNNSIYMFTESRLSATLNPGNNHLIGNDEGCKVEFLGNRAMALMSGRTDVTQEVVNYIRDVVINSPANCAGLREAIEYRLNDYIIRFTTRPWDVQFNVKIILAVATLEWEGYSIIKITIEQGSVTVEVGNDFAFAGSGADFAYHEFRNRNQEHEDLYHIGRDAMFRAATGDLFSGGFMAVYKLVRNDYRLFSWEHVILERLITSNLNPGWRITPFGNYYCSFFLNENPHYPQVPPAITLW